MSYRPAPSPDCTEKSGAVTLRIEAQVKDLGEVTVRRILPAKERRQLGPFVFFDHMGPAEFPPGKGITVRPHPHIGLATVTYLFAGQIMHRDSLGFTQAIRAGAVNLMTAGRGIVHSERAGDDLQQYSKLHGIQTWMALPDGREEMAPDFRHYAASEIPEVLINGVKVRVIMGEAYKRRSPVLCHSPTLYLECRMPVGARLAAPQDQAELGVYVVSGEVSIAGERYRDGVLAVAASGGDLQIEAAEDSRVMLIGGDALPRRHIWWNFVSSSRERIEKAKSDWQSGRFDKVPGDDEFMPLPDQAR